MSSSAVEALHQAGEMMDQTIRELRRMWATEEELRALAEAEAEEELRPVLPGPPRPAGYDWRETYAANHPPGLSRRDKRRWHT